MNKFHGSKWWDWLNQFVQKQFGPWWGIQHSWYLLWYWFKWGDCSIFDWLCFLFVNTWDYFILVIELTLFSIEAFSLLPRHALSLSHSLSKILWTCMLLKIISMFDIILGCLDVCLTCLDKMHVVYYISILTLMSYDGAWKAVQVCILTLLYCDLILFGTLFFKSP